MSDRTFTFDEEEVSSALSQQGGGSTLPGGEYIVQITDIQDREDGFARSGNHAGWPSVDLTLKIVASGTGAGTGQSVKRFNLGMFPKFSSGKSNFSFVQFFNALGVELKGKVTLPENEDIIGQEVGVVLGFQEPRQNKRGEWVIYNDVTRFFPPSDGVSEGSVPVPELPEGNAPANVGGFSAPESSSGGDTSSPWKV